ncbi:MAG: SAM-dependent methyltransferase [Dehalococcoidia bacterium]|nr:SAM-dependent methyltransferase [Dehalococcoidia bacterium]
MAIRSDLPPTEAELAIRAEIARDGGITFARFMELALFSVRGGYYSALRSARGRDEPGGRDYYTAPMAHPLFGQLLALQLDEVWHLLGQPKPFWVVELGCGDGLLARDVLAGLQTMAPDCFAATRCALVDRSASLTRREGAFGGRGQRVVASGPPFRDLVGCVLSNELLDAFPVHRFQAQGGALREIFVSLCDGRFVEELGAPSSTRLAERLESIRQAAPGLGEGWRGEVCLAAEGWVGEVARSLKRGVVLTVDYGDVTERLYGPERRGGTLQCYFRHTVSSSPYVRVGRQDITAHVDFRALAAFGEQAGLRTLGYTTQGQFLRNLGADHFVQVLREAGRELSQESVAPNRTGMLELVRPEGFGNFKVVAQAKGLDDAALSGFQEENAVRERVRTLGKALPLPLLSREHAPLLAGRYPHAAEAQHLERGVTGDG